MPRTTIYCTAPVRMSSLCSSSCSTRLRLKVQKKRF